MQRDEKIKQVVALIRRFKEGDEDAFDELYMATKEDVLRFIRFRFDSLNDEQMKDILQLSYIKIAGNLKAFEKDDKFMGWAFEIAKNAGLNYIRSEKKYVYIETAGDDDEEWFKKVPDDSREVDPYHNAYVAEIRNLILGELANMDKRMRKTFVLFYFDHLKMEEIAEVQNIKIGTVKSRLHNARKRLREKLKEHNISEY